MSTEQLQDFFEEAGFRFYVTDDGTAELEKWTAGGVDMLIYLNPFTAEEFERWVNDFDIDDTIDSHREAKEYKAAFTIQESLDDFNDFKEGLLELVEQLKQLA